MPSFTAAASGLSGAVDSLFSAKASEAKAKMYHLEAEGDVLKGKGAQIEGEAYTRARELALVNKGFAEESTRIQLVQSDRRSALATGGIVAGAAGSGLAQSGSVLDVLSDSASQSALEHQVIQKQGLITEEGYQEQADVYAKMKEGSDVAVQAALKSREIHIAAADMETDAATAKYWGAGIKGAIGIASLFTGGMGGGGGAEGLEALAGGAG